jgi:glyoxylase-like metal-dependent hydrolase (beta-lactamase superfamily II)
MPPIRLIRANNPSPLTGSGTNTYLLGQGEVAVIDPGPDLDSHLTAVLGALTPGERISHILVTHAHLDHSALTSRLARITGAPVMAFGIAHAGRSATMTALAAEGLRGAEGVDTGFAPDQVLADNACLSVAGVEIRALHLPGHMGCHMGFAVGEVLFSGDHVMDWSTTLVSPPDGDMGDYMASLHRLAAGNWRRMLPGHGREITDPAARIGALIDHRLAREASILASLRNDGPATAAALAARIYTDTPPHLLPAATRNVLSHLIDLAARSLTQPQPGPLATTVFQAMQITR